MFDDGIDIYNSMLFKYDLCLKNIILQTETVKINPKVADIINVRFQKEYDLVNLSNILTYYFRSIEEYITFYDKNFNLKEIGQIISYFFNMKKDAEEKFNFLLNNNGYIEDINNGKILVYKK